MSLDTLKVIKKGKYISPRQIDKNIPKDVCRLIHKMTRPKAKRRYQSIDAVLRQVKKYLKHYDTHELRVQLAKSVVAGKLYTFAPEALTQKDRVRRIIKRVCRRRGRSFCLPLVQWFYSQNPAYKMVYRSQRRNADASFPAGKYGLTGAGFLF